MKINLVKDEMSTLLENLSEQFDLMDAHEEMIPQIELDIFKRNIQKLYENAIHLNKLNGKEIVSEEFIVEDKKVEEPKIEEKIEIEEVVIEKEIPQATIQEEQVEEPKEIAEEDLVVDLREEELETELSVAQPKEDIAELQREEVIAQINEEDVEETQTETTSLLFDDILKTDQAEQDLFSNVQPNSEIKDLNNKLAEARNTHSIVEKLQNNRIESLKSVIGINDKFYFINELFAGDNQKYEDVIYTLNNFKKLDDAMQYFSTLKYRFAWDEESDAYLKLTQMLERKFQMIDA